MAGRPSLADQRSLQVAIASATAAAVAPRGVKAIAFAQTSRVGEPGGGAAHQPKRER